VLDAQRARRGRRPRTRRLHATAVSDSVTFPTLTVPAETANAMHRQAPGQFGSDARGPICFSISVLALGAINASRSLATSIISTLASPSPRPREQRSQNGGLQSARSSRGSEVGMTTKRGQGHTFCCPGAVECAFIINYFGKPH
jgi:hypothetical protein